MSPNTSKQNEKERLLVQKACSVIRPQVLYFEPSQDMTLSEAKKVLPIVQEFIAQHNIKIFIVKASKSAWESPDIRERIRHDLAHIREHLDTMILLNGSPFQKVQSQFFAQPLKGYCELFLATTLEEALEFLDS